MVGVGLVADLGFSPPWSGVGLQGGVGPGAYPARVGRPHGIHLSSPLIHSHDYSSSNGSGNEPPVAAGDAVGGVGVGIVGSVGVSVAACH